MKKGLLPLLLLVFTVLAVTASLVIGVSANNDDPAPELRLNGANVSFLDSVHLLFSVECENVEHPENIRLLVWRGRDGIHTNDLLKGSEDHELMPMENPPEGMTEDSIVFSFSKIAAAEMTEDFYFRAYCVSDGEIFYSSVKKYSVLQYAMNKLGVTGTASDNELFKNMLRSMLAYGTDAQKYFGVNLDRLATDEYVKIKVNGTTFDDGTSASLVKRGEGVTLKANTTPSLPYATFADENGAILCKETSYTFTAEKSMTVTVTLSDRSSSLTGAFDADGAPDAFLDFDGNLKDTGKVGADVTENGTVVFGKGYAAEKSGSAYFDGTGYLTLDGLQLGNDDFSLAFWINPEDLAYNNYLRYKIPIVSTSESFGRSSDGMNVLIDIENGALAVALGSSEAGNGMYAYFYFYKPTSNKAESNADRYVGKPDHTYFENKWTHFAIVMDRGNGMLRIYMDFEEVYFSSMVYFGTSTQIPPELSADSLPMTVGQYGVPNADTHKTLSYVDDLAIFKRAISADDVAVMEEYYSKISHEHSFSSEWSYDSETHWHGSTCGHKVRADESEHFIGADGACVSNCGYQGEPPHQHTFSEEWSMDEAKHWRDATCEHVDVVNELSDHTYSEDGFCTKCGFNRVVTITLSDIEQGGWSYGNKNGISAERIRVARLIPVSAGTVIEYNLNGMELFLDLADGIGSTTGNRSGWLKGSGAYIVEKDCYLGITLAASGRVTAVVPDDFTGVSISLTLGGKAEGELKKLNVYRFGGEGNDWCFVYLPDDYDPDRAEPYPFVIANHGNGWVMNGSYQMANWTNISQYMSPSEIASQPESLRSRFIATDDPDLWYSNPTIEALLNAGYIVAGAQNYGDGLYGNDNCTDACVAFFNHMTETYNVEDSCYMIGASNGAMTTLNAAAKLGEKVKSIILQYPLASIISQYSAGNHRDAIESAYGLDQTKTYTESELKELISEYDPLYKNVENGVKIGYFPSVKIYYSLTDTTTPASANALPLIAMLEKSGIEYQGVRVDTDGVNKQHGHIDHFDPSGFVEWFDNH